ncbi:keratinocyte differentiation factor 1 [Electrophorus electricus]|uniref:keratinocyte differentiation factor 1 n=1 Tax=Electrophorus electricus TaxID=8005 RepID=UPI0015CFD467|nr:keratinocyte differentiation factor 1 [Electrophorus electricus]
MSGHSTGTNHKSHSHTHSSGHYRADGYRQGRTKSRDNTTSQDLYRDQYGSSHDSPRDPHTNSRDLPQDSSATSRNVYREPHDEQLCGIDMQPSCKPLPRYANGRGSELLGFVPGSAALGATSASGSRSCSSCASLGWSGCRALLCCVLTCGLYNSHPPCLPAGESSTDTPPKVEAEPRKPTVMANSNPACGVPLEPSKPPQLPSSGSFRYRDVYLAGKQVIYPLIPEAPQRHSRVTGKGESQRPISNTSIYSREDLDLDDVDDNATDIDSLITRKLLELYKLHQIEQLAKCTSDLSFSRKTNEISDLINSIAQDYNLEEQEAECRLVHGVMRISTRKYKSQASKGKSKDYRSQDALLHANGRRDGTLPDSGNETMTFTFSNGDPEVQVSDLTPSDELARKMRVHSGRSAYASITTTDSSGVPLLC